MTTSTAATAKAAPPAKPAKPAAVKPDTWYVLDSTAGPDTLDSAGRTISGDRTHEQWVDGAIRQFTFKRGVPLELPISVAVQFLRHTAFLRTDATGKVITYVRPPKQQEELQAGEKLTIATDQTIARYDELSNAALQQRALEMRGGRQFLINPVRKAMIDFIIAAKETTARANTSKISDEFVVGQNVSHLPKREQPSEPVGYLDDDGAGLDEDAA